jgi:hypothetical protein
MFEEEIIHNLAVGLDTPKNCGPGFVVVFIKDQEDKLDISD